MSAIDDLIDENKELFKLNWITDPDVLVRRGKEIKLMDPHFLEMSAWCAELHEQVYELAKEAGLDVLLMGGNAAALRLEAHDQRGSRDNDYLTTASEEAIKQLIAALTERFAEAFPAPFFRHRRIGPPKGERTLPLLAYAVDVPARLDRNAVEGKLGVKLEFHLSSEKAFPEAEEISGEFLAVPQLIKARVPRRPYQLVLKLMVLVDPPIGVYATREDVIPRQLYDIDVLLEQLTDKTDWTKARDYAAVRYADEMDQHEVTGSTDELWRQLDSRLLHWSEDAASKGHSWILINQFQESQVARGNKRGSDDWAARAARLAVAARCLSDSANGWKRWQRALALEAKLDPNAGGQSLKAQRRALEPVVGVPAKKQSPKVRTTFWMYLAQADSLQVALDEISEALSVLGS